MYLAVLGRQNNISVAELEAKFSNVHLLNSQLAVFESSVLPNINQLGGSLKLAIKLKVKPLDFLINLPAGKIIFGISDYSKNASRQTTISAALKLKKILTRHGRSVRVVENKASVLSTATSLHNGLSGKNEHKVELIKVDQDWYRVIGVQDIDAYTRRDQARPARDAKVGMLPPKLAQILINLCGELPTSARILDPFCGTGVVLQEAILMGYSAYGTDINERMVKYSNNNLNWLLSSHVYSRLSSQLEHAHSLKSSQFQVTVGDATSFQWSRPLDAIVCEGYLGKPFSKIPTEVKLKEQKQECGTIILGFLKNLTTQIKSNTPVVIAIPAWRRESGAYERLEILDEINSMGYNVDNKSCEGLLYYREGQIVARDIIILRKK